MAVRLDLQPLFRAWSYSDLCVGLASALTVSNVCLDDAE